MFFARSDGASRWSLRARLVASTVAAVALALSIGFAWARRNLERVLLDQVDEVLVNKHRELKAVAGGSLEALARELEREIEVYERVEMTVRIDRAGAPPLVGPNDPGGRRIADRMEDVVHDRTARTLAPAEDVPGLRVYGGSLSLADGTSCRIAIAVSLQRSEETLRLFDRRVLWGGLTLVAIAVPVGFWLYRQALRPVTKAVSAARLLDAKDMTARLPRTGSGDELDQLSQVINELLEKLEQHHARVIKFTADASHELRTPLAAMKTAIDVSLQRPRDPNESAAVLETLGEQCERLTVIVERLQLLARADAGRLLPRQEVVDLGGLVEETAEFLAPLAEERGLRIESRVARGVAVDGDPAYLRQVVVNLLDNAMKFTPAGGLVEIAVSATEKAVALAIRDTGVGIPARDLAHLFERFYRTDAARLEKGSGLGLSICRTIVEAHGGTIGATSEVRHGSVFTVTLPRRKA
jgi:heavy metal sensor kinase